MENEEATTTTTPPPPSTTTSTKEKMPAAEQQKEQEQQQKQQSFRRSSVLNTFHVPVVGRVGFGSSWERRLQTLALFSCSMYFFFLLSFLCSYYTLLLLLFPFTTLPMLIYLSCIFLGFDKSPVTGSRWAFLRHDIFRWWWSNACDYFPITLVKTSQLDQKKSYVMGYHPHGIISVGALGAFGTSGARTLSLVDGEIETHDGSETSPRGFSSLFPGIDRRLITLPINFQTPFAREYTLSMGCCNSSRETFRNVLSRNKGEGNAIVVVVGGAAESMMVHRGTIDLVLDKRKGFVREAILSNACLVPVLAFGETDLYHVTHLENVEEEKEKTEDNSKEDDNKSSSEEPTPPKENADRKKSMILQFQSWVKNTTGVAVPLFRGRSIFFQDFGFMPIRTPVVVIVGTPIEPPKEAGKKFAPQIDYKTNTPLNDDGKILIEHHSKYVEALKKLYQQYKNAVWNEPGQLRQGSLCIRA